MPQIGKRCIADDKRLKFLYKIGKIFIPYFFANLMRLSIISPKSWQINSFIPLIPDYYRFQNFRFNETLARRWVSETLQNNKY